MAQTIFSIIGWVGTAIVFASVGVRFLKPAWDQYAIWGAWTGLACVIVYTLAQWRDIVDYFRRRQARYGAMATLSVLVALGIVVAVNYLANRENKRWDLTANKQNSLSEQTIKVLKGLDAPVKFTAFDRQTSLDRFRTKLEEYKYQSRQVSADYIDPDQRPVVAKQYEIDAYGTVVVEYKGRKERATSDNEQDLTNALIKVVSGKERTVYFLEGHGEKDPTRMERDGYSAVAELLKRDNYKVEKLVLAQQKELPVTDTVVIMAGPTSDLLPDEVSVLRTFLEKQGKLMVLADPVLPPKMPLPNLEALLKDWAIVLNHDVVVDVSGATNDPSLAVAATYPPHDATDRFTTLTIYPLARSVEPATSSSDGRFALPLAQTGARSWGEADLASLNSPAGVAMDKDKGDIAGPVTIAVAATGPMKVDPKVKLAETGTSRPETRLVVFGDSDFASNAYAGVAGNPNFFANTVNWLAQQENLIAIRPTQANDRRVTVTARQQQGIFVASIVLIPALVFGAGIFTWWRRR